MNFRIASIFSVALSLGFAASAETLPEVWTLDDCMQYAETHNIQLLQKRIAVRQNEQTVEANEGALFPSLSFATNHNVSWRPWAQTFTDLNNGTLTTSANSVNYNGTYGLNAQWTVWNGGRNRKNLQRSRKAVEQSQLDTEMTLEDLRTQIAQYYIQILYQSAAVEVNSKILDATKMQRDRAKEMYEVGSMSRADLAQMEAQVSQDEYNLTNSITQLENFKLQLKSLLQLVEIEDFQVAIPDVKDEAVLRLVPSQAEVYAQALATRPEIGYSKLGIELADLDINIARRGYYPSLSMSGAVNTSNTSGMDGFGSHLKRNLNNAVGLTLSVPIFDNRQNKTNVAKARLARDNAELQLDAARTQLYSDIENYRLNAVNAQRQYEAAKVNVASMTESFNLVNEQFNVGLKDIVDLITAKNNLLQADQQMLQAKYTALLNIALLRFYAGYPLTLE